MKMEFKYGDKIVLSVDDDFVPRKDELIKIGDENYIIKGVQNIVDSSLLYINKIVFIVNRIPKMSEVMGYTGDNIND